MSVIITDRRISSKTDRRERGDGTPQSDDSAHEEARLRDRVHDHVRRDLHLWVMSSVSDLRKGSTRWHLRRCIRRIEQINR